MKTDFREARASNREPDAGWFVNIDRSSGALRACCSAHHRGRLEHVEQAHGFAHQAQIGVLVLADGEAVVAAIDCRGFRRPWPWPGRWPRRGPARISTLAPRLTAERKVSRSKTSTPELHQLMGMAAVDGAGGDGDMGEMAAHMAGDGRGCDRAPPTAMTTSCGLADAGGVQQVEPGGIAIEDLDAEALDQLDLGRIVVDQGHFEALGAQHAGDDLAEAAIAEHDDLAAARRYRRCRGCSRRASRRGAISRSKANSSSGVVAMERATATVEQVDGRRRRWRRPTGRIAG